MNGISNTSREALACTVDRSKAIQISEEAYNSFGSGESLEQPVDIKTQGRVGLEFYK